MCILALAWGRTLQLKPWWLARHCAAVCMAIQINWQQKYLAASDNAPLILLSAPAWRAELFCCRSQAVAMRSMRCFVSCDNPLVGCDTLVL